MPHDMLVFLRRPPEALFTILAPVRVVFRVYGYDVPLEARGVCRAVFAILTLVDFPPAVGLHVLLQLQLLPESPLATLALKRQVLGVNGEDVTAEYKRVGSLKIAVPTLVDLFPFVGLAMLFELRGPVETFLADLALVREVLRVNGDDVPLEVTGVGALVIAMRALVGLVALKEFGVLLQLLLVGEGLRAVFAFEGQVSPVLGFDVRLQVGLIRAAEDAVLALVRLLPRVGPHVFFQLRRVAEAFPALDTNVGEVLAVNCQQVPVQQALLGGFVVTIFALVHFRFFIP